MSKVTNLRMKSKRLVIGQDMVEFDAAGVAEVTSEQADILVGLNGGYSVLEDENIDPQDENPPQVDKSSNEEEKPQIEDSGVSGEDETIPEEKPEIETTEEEIPEDEDDKTSESAKFDAEDLDNMTVPALKKVAKDNGIDLAGATKKDDIIPIILGSMK